MDQQENNTGKIIKDDIQELKVNVGKISLLKKIITAIALLAFLAVWFLYHSLYVAEAQNADEVKFTIERGETIDQLAEKLEAENIISNKWLFKKYLVFKGIDKKVQAGNLSVLYPITLARVANSLQNAIADNERVMIIIPGWNLRDIAEYLANNGFVEDMESFYAVVGEPAKEYAGDNAPMLDFDIEIIKEKPKGLSYEGYLAPDTYRIYMDATLNDILEKLILQQDKVVTDKMLQDIKNSGRTLHEILTMASIIEREVRTPSEKARVADIFWKRYDKGWPLQADSTVHYVTGEKGDVFTTAEERGIDNPWNTYKYPGLPPGPISAPDENSIRAAIYPERNNYWYFLTTLDGEVKYAKDLDEHNRNVQKYLR